MFAAETRRFRNFLCVLFCLRFSLFFRFFLFQIFLHGVFQLVRHSDVTKQGRLETWVSHSARNSAFEKLLCVLILLVSFLVVFQILFSKNYFWCVFRLSTQILSSSTDMHQLRSFLFWFSHFFIFFFWEVVNPDFFSKELGGIKFCCFEIVIKNNGQNSCFYFGNTNIASNPMFPILFCCSGPFIVSLFSELRILSN